jgi:hypothetical protein
LLRAAGGRLVRFDLPNQIAENADQILELKFGISSVR